MSTPANNKDIEANEEMADDNKSKEIVSKLMKDPQMLAALQYNLNRYVGAPSGYIASLPDSVKRRIKALKNLQVEYTNMEVEFFKEVNALEAKYHKMHLGLYEKRYSIISGEHEPTDEEANFTLDDEAEEEENEEKLSDNLDKKASIQPDNSEKPKEDPKGIPEFWLTIFKNVDLLMDMVQDYDEPILSKLKDIKLVLPEDSLGFTLEFHFDENDYFTNKVLTKYYEMKCEPSESDPFSFEGPEINSCKGCTIDWKKGKNVTVKTIKKKQKHKSRGSVRTVTKTVANDSFFNFFNPPQLPDELDEDLDDETNTLLMADYEIGHYIRERIIPRAVLFFTGEALEDEDYEEEGEGDEMDEEDLEEEEDEEKDPDYNPATDPKVDPNQQCPNQ